MIKKEYQNFFTLDNCIYEYLVQLCNKSTRKPWKKTNDTTCTKTFLIFDNCIYEHLVHQLENHEKNIAITIFDPWQLHLWVFKHFFLTLFANHFSLSLFDLILQFKLELEKCSVHIWNQI